MVPGTGSQTLHPLFTYTPVELGIVVQFGRNARFAFSVNVCHNTGSGLFEGFDSSVFAVSFAITMIVVYDAAGVRRQAGMHAERINRMINEIFAGQPINEKQLKEVIGHTPRQVIAG
jgi:acid phosphatase family membrane protein YuiD